MRNSCFGHGRRYGHGCRLAHLLQVLNVHLQTRHLPCRNLPVRRLVIKISETLKQNIKYNLQEEKSVLGREKSMSVEG
jgi:hypothetical protein